MKNQLRVLVCGGRDYEDIKTLRQVLNSIDISYESADCYGPISCIISGGARGADRLAEVYAREKDIPLEIYPAQWNTYGKAAGIIRNQEMLDDGQPDLVVAFPGGKGTAHMTNISKKANLKVINVEAVSKLSWPGPGV